MKYMYLHFPCKYLYALVSCICYMEIVDAKIKRILKIIIYKEQLFAIDSYIIDIVIISLAKMATDHSNL